MRELARIVRGYARTGDVELLFVKIEPCGLDKTETEKRDCYNSSCDDCRREFWMQEVK